jgi:hypothetical protein
VSASDVTAALQDYEALLRERGALVVRNLRPGIAPEQIGALESEYGFQIPDEARAVWLWHNGIEGVGSIGGPAVQLTAFGGGFGDLEFALRMGRQRVEIMVEGFAYSGVESEYAGLKILDLLVSGVDIIIDVTPGRSVLTYMSDPVSRLHDFPIMPIAHRVRWWIWAIENGAWTVNPDGSWAIDHSKHPEGRYRNTF